MEAAQKAVTAGEGDRTAPGAGMSPAARFDSLRGELTALQLPLGWDFSAPISTDRIYWLRKVMGLLLTTAALTMGAPFWFDLLSKLVNIRAAGNRPDTSRRVAPDARKSNRTED